jgi:hypothetical protein
MQEETTDGHRYTQIRSDFSGTFPGRASVYRTVTQSKAEQDRSAVLRIRVYLCPSVVVLSCYG